MSSPSKTPDARGAPSEPPPPPPLIGRSRFQIRATGDAAKNYDFVQSRGQRKTTNVIESIGHLIKSCLGGGVVAIHESYKDCGLWTAVVLNVLLGIAVSYCMYMLARSAQKMYGRVQIPSMTYPDLAEASLAAGPWNRLRNYAKAFRYIVDTIIIIDLFGACCVYEVVVARAIKQLVEETDDVVDEGHPSIRLYIIGLILPFMLLCMITTLKYLAPFSIVADIFIFLLAIATVYYGVKSSQQSPLDMPVFKSIPGLFEFMGVCVFSMEGIGATLAIENSMTDPRKIAFVLVGGMSVVTATVMVVGFFGYWGFGEKSSSPITVNFPWEPFPVVLKVLLALMIYVTFALNFWIPFELIWHYLKTVLCSPIIVIIFLPLFHSMWGNLTLTVPFPYVLYHLLLIFGIIAVICQNKSILFFMKNMPKIKNLQRKHNQERFWLWERVYRAIFVVGISMIAFALPNVSKFIGLIGSFCLSNMGFIFPAFIELSMEWNDPGLGCLCWRLWKAVIIITFGLTLCCVGTYTNSKEMIMELFIRKPSGFLS